MLVIQVVWNKFPIVNLWLQLCPWDISIVGICYRCLWFAHRGSCSPLLLSPLTEVSKDSLQIIVNCLIFILLKSSWNLSLSSCSIVLYLYLLFCLLLTSLAYHQHVTGVQSYTHIPAVIKKTRGSAVPTRLARVQKHFTLSLKAL